MTIDTGIDALRARCGDLGRLSRRRAALAAMALAIGMVAAGCGGSGSSTGADSSTSGAPASFYTGGTPGGTPVRGGVVTIASPEAPTSLDPVTNGSEPGDERVSTEIFDTLVEIMPGGGVPQPALASSWHVSDHGLVYTFAIRQGVRFSNGEPLTAADVAYSLLRDKTLSISTGVAFTGPWKSVSATGPMTVQIKLKEPQPMLLESIVYPQFGIVPKNVVSHESESQFSQHPVGTGPFMLKSTTPGNTTVTLVRNPRYWRAGKPYLNGLVFNQVESENARILAVRTGTATMATSIPYSQVTTLKKISGVRMLIEPLWGSSLNPINDTKPPLNEANVRRALLYATPYQEIIKAVYKGYGTQANSVGVGEMKNWNPSLPTYAFDLAKAKALLKTTSVPNGFPLTLTIRGGEAAGELIASILQNTWAQIGVHVTIHSVDATTINSDQFTGKYEMALLPPEAGLSESYDATNILPVYLSGAFFPVEVPSARLKAQLAKLLTTQDPSTRQALVHEVQVESYAQEPNWLPIINLVTLNLASDALRGVQFLPNDHVRMEQAWLAR